MCAGVVRRLLSRVLRSLAERVGRDDLFEKPGERVKATPLQGSEA